MKILAVIVAACLAGQAAGAPMAGTWRAEFEGRTFITLELESANGTVTGLISLGRAADAARRSRREGARGAGRPRSEAVRAHDAGQGLRGTPSG